MGTVFWILEGILYTVFLTGDWCDFLGVPWITGTDWYMYSSICKYAALLICVWYGCRLGWQKGNRKQKVLCGVLLFAAVADYFLLFTDSFILGILFFCIVQCCYCLFFAGEKGSRVLYRMAGTGICVAVLVWCLIQAGIFGDAAGWKNTELYLILTAVFYASLLLQNLVRAWKQSKAVSIWGRVAILLLFLCDIHVALYNIDGERLWKQMQLWCEAAGVLMWMFYLPSQLCIIKCIQGEKYL